MSDSKQILIVDDTRENLLVLGTILRRAGHGVVEAITGAGALDLARTLQPELILLDVVLPDMDGFAVCAALREAPATAEIPVIFITSLTEASDRVHGLSQGAVDYITKPFDRSEVLLRVATHLRLRRLNASLVELNQKLADRQRQLDEDLQAAAALQRALLPREELQAPNLAVAWRFEPCASIGGDIFGVLPIHRHEVALYMLDVSGHSVPSALVTFAAAQSLSLHGGVVAAHGDGVARASPPGDVLARLDRERYFERFERFCTLAYALLDTRDGRLRVSSAGHPPVLLVRRDGSVEELSAGGPPIGLGLEGTFPEDERRLAPGDRLVLVTDGIMDCADDRGERFGWARLLQTIGAHRDGTPGELCAAILRTLEAFRGAEPAPDDISLLICEFQPPATSEVAHA